MPEFSFTLIVEGSDIQSDELVNALYEAGCDDALVGRSDGVQFLDFDREADSAAAAVLTAVADVESVVGLSVTRIADSGLVSMADIAERTGRTRESVRLLVAGHRGPGGFPPPATNPRGRYRLWRTRDVEEWMRDQLGEACGWHDDALFSAVNVALELRHHSNRLPDSDRDKVRSLIDL